MSDDTFDYDISNYTDDELISDILELDNPTDRELESKILKDMRECNEGTPIYKFYEDIYDYFFSEDSKITEGLTGLDNYQGAASDPITKYTDAQFASDPIFKISKDKQLSDIASKKTGIMDFSTNIINTNPIEYPTGKRNPIARQTMFKMLSIDSQFRDDYYNTSATSFNMNLSTSISDVISMKLYSVQIPYTWYTINNNFGSNFIFLKGNSPGINNGDHDIQIKIPSGNYDAASLMSAINNRITTLSSGYSTSQADPYDYRDLSFGNTRAVYDAATVKTRFEFDLKKIYNESDYHMVFPSYTTPNDIFVNILSIPGFLGFNYDTYDVFKVYSDLRAYSTNDTTGSTFQVIHGINSYFDIIKYQGPPPYTGNSIIQTFRIDITNQTVNSQTYSRTQLIHFFNTALTLSNYIDPSYSSFSQIDIDISGNINNGFSHFEIKIKLNRKTTQNIENGKIVIKFQNETQEGAHIWTGSNSCFKFINDINEICELTTETPTLLTNYIVDNDSAKIIIDCIKPNYNVSENQRISTVAPSPVEGYLQDAYISAINNSLIEMNALTKVPVYKPNGEFNIRIDSNFNLQNTYLTIANSIANFQFDINREFDQTSYIVDLSSSILSKNPFFFNSLYSDLSLSYYTISTTTSGLGSYTIDGSNNRNNRIRIYPKSTINGYTNFGNQNSPSIDFDIPPKTYASIGLLVDAFNTSFRTKIDDDNSAVMSGSEMSYEFNQNGQIDLYIKLQIKKVLTEKDYSVSFVDPTSANSWYEYLFMRDPSYHLINYTDGSDYANIYGSENFYSNTILINENNNKIQFIPYINGVADNTGANDIFITVPPSTTPYTRQGLIDALNTNAASNTLLSGTQFTLITNINKQYTKLRLNINKVFRSSDYKFVIYDATSFVYCNIGVTNSLNIRNSTFDSTLGWLLGFHSFTEYELVDFTKPGRESGNYANNIYSNADLGFSYSYNDVNYKISIIGDSILNTNLYNYFLVVLDDYVQSHMNDGLITVASLEKDVALPSYASRAQYICEPIPGSNLTRKVAVSGTSKLNTNLTSNQLYAMNQLYQTRQTRNKSYSSGPSLKDVFAIVPLKLSGQPGGNYVEFGGTLQNQDRKYFGPVRIQKLSIKLMNDKGDVVDLNGADWSITIICEILTQSGEN
jgi:hypothetical protein